MKKANTKAKRLLPYLALTVVSALALVSITKAYIGEAPKVVVEGNYIEAAQQAIDNVSDVLGGAVESVDKYFHGTVTFEGNVVPGTQSYFPINVPLDLTGTSTAKGATQNIIASWTNTGADKILTNLRLDISTQLSALLGKVSYGCSTSTWVGGVVGGSLSATSTLGLIATTTLSGTYDTGDTWILDNSKLATTTNVLVKTGEVVFCTRIIVDATSSDSFSVAGKFTGVGRMLGNIWARGN